ncbi:S-layer homology domain-containing protein [Paenibacillus marinisediminis]
MLFNTKKRLHKVIVTLLAVSMTLSAAPAAMAAQNTAPANTSASNASGYSPVFSDVKLGHWSEKHIHKLASLGILQGNQGKFRPTDPITQQEVIAVAIRFMGLDDKVQKDTAVKLPEEIKVSNYFKGYVVLALKEGLIDLEEESAVTKDKTAWGERKATREWVSKILVRAAGKKSDAEAAMNTPTSFADNSEISSDALGYVNVAVDLNLTTGMDKNRFVPKGTVTREQAATFFSRADEKVSNVDYANDSYGIVTGMTDDQIKLYTEDNKWVNVRFDNKTMWYELGSDKAITPQDIPLYTKIRYIGQANNAVYVELVDQEKMINTTLATLKYSEANSLWVKQNGQEGLQEIKYETNTVFKDASGNTIKPTDLVENTELEITRETFSKDHKVIEIQVKTNQVNKSGSGKVTTLDQASRTLTVSNDKGVNETYSVSEKAVIRHNNTLLSLQDLKPSDSITFTVENNVITSIVLSRSPEASVEGKLVALDNSKKMITVVKDNGDFDTKLLSTLVDVQIEGMTNASIDNLIFGADYGDRVKMTVNSEGKVTHIQVLNRNVQSIYGATIKSYDTKGQYLVVEDANKNVKLLNLDNTTQYELNGNKVTQDAVLGMLLGNRKVNIQYIGEKALLVQFVYKYEGKYMASNLSSRQVTMELANKDIIIMPYEGPVLPVLVYGNKSATVADLKRGDQVTAMLSNNQSSIVSLSVRSHVQFDVEEVSTATNRVKLLNPDNKIEDYSLSNVALYDTNNNRITVSNINKGDVLNAVFDGTALVELRKVNVSMGRVQSVDVADGKVVVKDYNGQLYTFNSADGLTVLTDTGSTSNIATLKVGDRVEGRKDALNKPVLKVIPGSERTFWKYDSKTKELYVTRKANDTSKNYFQLHPNVIIHDAAGQTISVESLKNDDKLVLYFLNDQIIEIEKK